MHRLIAFRIGCLAGALAASGCNRPPGGPVEELAARAPLADRQAAWQVVLFGTPQAEPLELRGFVRTPPGLGDSLASAEREAEVRLTWTAPANRVALIDVAPAAGLRAQAAAVRLNDRLVGRLALRPGRRRLRLALPAEAQRVGENILLFRFGEVNPVPLAGGERVAALFYSLTIGTEGDRGLEDLMAEGAPAPISVAEPASVVQVGPSILYYGLRLPADAELRFTPRLHPAARDARGWADLGVQLEDEAGGEREVWRGRVNGGDHGEVRAALPGPAGALVRLAFRVDGPASRRFAWAVWDGPRVVGSAAPAPSPAGTDRVEALRRSLAGASVLMIVLDAAGARHFHCYGYPRATTPEIDRIAEEGILFERAFTPAVFTLAAMASVWTGLPPDESHRGVTYDAPLPSGPPTLAERLSARGIHTAGFVANGMAGGSFGLQRGFAEFREIYRDHGPGAEAFLDVLPPFFRANAARRFFAYAHFREPHFPYDPAPPFDTRFGPEGPLTADERRSAVWYTAVNARKITPTIQQADHLVRLYDGNLAYADQVVGALRRHLEEQGLWERTVVIVTADHGEGLLEHGFISHGEQVYDESTRIPLVVRLPGGPRGVRVTGFVDLLSLAPTIADVFGLAGPDGSGHAFPGGSLLPLVFGAPGKDAVFSRTVGERPRYAVRDARFRFVFNTRYGEEELYDLEKDPAEQVNVARARPVVAAVYRQDLARWIRGLERGVERKTARPPLPVEVVQNLKALGYAR